MIYLLISLNQPVRVINSFILFVLYCSRIDLIALFLANVVIILIELFFIAYNTRRCSGKDMACLRIVLAIITYFTGFKFHSQMLNICTLGRIYLSIAWIPGDGSKGYFLLRISLCWRTCACSGIFVCVECKSISMLPTHLVLGRGNPRPWLTDRDAHVPTCKPCRGSRSFSARTGCCCCCCCCYCCYCQPLLRRYQSWWLLLWWL